MNYKNLTWIMGMPRSGTSWISQLFDSVPSVSFKLSPLFSYAYKNAINSESSKTEFSDFFDSILNSSDDFMNQTYRRTSGEYPTFDKKTNNANLVIKDTRYHNIILTLLKHFPDIKIVYIVRNPMAAIHSWITNPNEFPVTDDPLVYWKNGKNRKTSEEEFWGFDDWCKVTKMYLDLKTKYANNIYIIKYEDLVHNTEKYTKELFAFSNLEYTEQTKRFIDECHTHNNSNVYSVYKDPIQVLNNWKNSLPNIIKVTIQNELKNTELYNYIT